MTLPWLKLFLIDLVFLKYYVENMSDGKIDRTQILIVKKNELDDIDTEYWAKATIEEKLETITYLRECFYGEEATTGRLQRIYTMLKLK